MTGRRYTYILRDAAGRVLWVGQTRNPSHRIQDHRVRQPWRAEIAEVEITEYATGDAALLAEHELIRTLQPAYNRLGVTYNAFGTERVRDQRSRARVARTEA